MVEDARLEQLVTAAGAASSGGLKVHLTVVSLDERQDGELVTRVALLVDDPSGDTWSPTEIRTLRDAVERAAAELELPEVSLTLVPESEREVFESLKA